jgi:hypothetical protein
MRQAALDRKGKINYRFKRIGNRELPVRPHEEGREPLFVPVVRG